VRKLRKNPIEFIGSVISYLVVLLFIVFEELLWKRIGKPVYVKIKSLKIMVRFEKWVKDVNNRYVLLAVFLAPFVLMEIVGTLGLMAIGSGAIITGLGFYVIKGLLTIPVVSIFNTGKKELVQFQLIRQGYYIVIWFKRDRTYRKAKRAINVILKNLSEFSEDVFDGDTEMKDGFVRIYKNIKKEI
jgi:hypothetical protein